MPPKKSVDSGSASADPSKPDEASLQFAFECLKAFDDNGVLDIGVLSKAMGHTNVASTRNAFTRYKKRWAFGNISTKTTATVTDEAGDGVTLKPNNDANKVAKKRGRRSAKASPTKKSASTAESSDDGQGAADLKAEASDTD
ncbi:uncharacterized protein BHQ10_010018 [Talaromyces amestolkiae]|uniref:Uncharacterized protein n=1 Tax=Talaromyces amestolkiae TaxID=1196081 RepID=A0A364LDW5_TALAM|nr:uncharacterized protein BHQ10_010018 [Talaromyces amestolkiae]RAO74006.1 hypothetical protein BHQ10_010018 [Talaromyces amestolkiae]